MCLIQKRPGDKLITLNIDLRTSRRWANSKIKYYGIS